MGLFATQWPRRNAGACSIHASSEPHAPIPWSMANKPATIPPSFYENPWVLTVMAILAALTWIAGWLSD
jgi:hypothetical protein